MASAAMFDIMLQFHQTAIQDLQLRVLNASLATNLRVKSPFSRLIEQPVPPLEIKACWNKPTVTLSNGCIELSAEVNGGARQVATGRILTLDGSVSARQSVVCAVDMSERPYACVETPNPIQLSMRKLQVSYEGSRWPSFLAKLNPAKEATLLRPVLTTQLFGPLACIPLTYMPYSLPIALPTKKSTATEALPIVHVLPGVLNAPASIALGLMLDMTQTAPSTFTSLLPEKANYNAAISISTQGLNTLIAHLCRQGEATGQLQHSRLGQITWRWETLTVTLRQQGIQLAGMLVQQGSRAQIQAQVRCQLVTNGCLQCTLLSSNTNATLTETLLASWTELLKTLLRSRAANKQDQDPGDPERLFQCFDVPGTTRTVETIAQELLVVDDQLIIYYTIPQSRKGFQLELPPPKPAVTITQPHIPHQTAQGAPVTIELEAQITKDSTPPYDYAWTSDLSPNPVPQFGSTYTISSVPLKPAVGEGPQTLTTAHLKVIDMFGQVAETQAPVKYIPYTKQKRQPKSQIQAPAQNTSDTQGKPTGCLSALGKIMMLLMGIMAVLRLFHVIPPSNHNISIPHPQNPGVYMTFTGAVNGTLSVPNPVACGVSKLDSANYEIQASGSVNDTSYLLLIQVSPYSGSGTYNTSDSSGLVALQGDSNGWGSNSQPGSITITGDRTGSISATMASGNSQVQVSGSWICP